MAGPWDRVDEIVAAKGSTKGPWDRVDEIVGGKSTAPEKEPSFLDRAMPYVKSALKPITDIPGNVASEFRAGSEEVKAGLPKSGDDFGHPLDVALGGLRQFASPLTGTVKSLVGDPIRENVGTGRLGESVARTAETVAGFAAPIPLAKVGKIALETAPKAFSEAAELLRKEGVRLTPGQLRGGLAKATEDKLTSVPIMGDAVKAASRRSIDDLNVAAYNRALAPIGEKFSGGEVGRKGVAEVEEKISAGYEKIKPKLTLSVDEDFRKDVETLRQEARELGPQAESQFNEILKNRVEARLGDTGRIDGETFKAIESQLSQRSSVFSASADGAQREVGRLVTKLNGALRDQLERSNPEVRAELRKLNEAWGIFATVRSAATNRAGSLGVFTPGDLATAVKRGDKSAGKGALARGEARLQDLSDAAVEVLPSKYADSGTAGRVGLGALAAEAYHDPAFAAKLAAGGLTGAAFYSPPGIAAMNSLAGSVAGTRNALARILQPGADAYRSSATILGGRGLLAPPPGQSP